MPSKKKVVAGVLGAAALTAAAGVAAKLLSNPKNRKLLADKVNEIKKLTGKSIKNAQKQLGSTVEKAKESLDHS